MGRGPNDSQNPYLKLGYACVVNQFPEIKVEESSSASKFDRQSMADPDKGTHCMQNPDPDFHLVSRCFNPLIIVKLRGRT